jgi:hypothetical protein
MAFKSWNIKIEKENLRYKKLFRVFGIPISEGWQQLPAVKSVAITRRAMKKRLSVGYSVVNASSVGVEFYVVYLIGNQKNIRVAVCKKKSFKDAEIIANNLANYFNVNVMDYASKEEATS